MDLFIKDLSEQVYSCKENFVVDNLTAGERIALKEIQSWADHSIYLQDKGARLVIMKDSDFDAKIMSQLGNQVHYLPLLQNQSVDYTIKIENWAKKWINKKAIPDTMLKFVVNPKATAAKAKGLIKSHKQGNPARLLLSGCNTAIENLSIFVDYYLTPLAKKLPSFIQDSTDFLNKLLDLDYKPTTSTLLVSFDVVNMF